MTVIAGEEFTITVPFIGVPTPKPLWLVNGCEIVPDSRIKFETFQNETIFLNKSAKRATDSGSYTIQLYNAEGSDSASCRVLVVGKIFFTCNNSIIVTKLLTYLIKISSSLFIILVLYFYLNRVISKKMH